METWGGGIHQLYPDEVKWKKTTGSLNYYYTNEAIEEIEAYFKTRKSLIGVDGRLVMDVNFETNKRAFLAISGKPTHVR